MKTVFNILMLAIALAWGGPASVQAADKKPNILVIWGDDIGVWNISHNNRGMMGYMTPNIDRIAREGLSFTDYYGQQSCTAGRAAFIGGNVPVRTQGRMAKDGRHDGHRPQEPGLCHRSIRQEPSG
jgi:arylsulfatase